MLECRPAKPSFYGARARASLVPIFPATKRTGRESWISAIETPAPAGSPRSSTYVLFFHCECFVSLRVLHSLRLDHHLRHGHVLPEEDVDVVDVARGRRAPCCHKQTRNERETPGANNTRGDRG